MSWSLENLNARKFLQLAQPVLRQNRILWSGNPLNSNLSRPGIVVNQFVTSECLMHLYETITSI